MILKKIAAVTAAFSLCAVSFASLAASAAEKMIDYTANSELALGDEGNVLRRNIYNVWGNSVEDIDAETPVSGYIKINFTISGIGSDTSRKDAEKLTKYDANGSADYIAFIGGAAGGNTARHSITGASDGTDEYISITGDGTYDVTWTLTEPSSNIQCLYLQTNICYIDYLPEDEQEAEKAKKNAADKNIAGSNVTITINSIVTEEPEEDTTEDTTQADNNDDTTEATTTNNDSSSDSGNDSDGDTKSTTAGNASTTTASTTATTTATTAVKTTTTAAAATTAATTAASSSTTDTATVSNTATGDAGIAAAVAALAVAGAAAIVSKKKD